MPMSAAPRSGWLRRRVEAPIGSSSFSVAASSSCRLRCRSAASSGLHDHPLAGKSSPGWRSRLARLPELVDTTSVWRIVRAVVHSARHRERLLVLLRRADHRERVLGALDWATVRSQQGSSWCLTSWLAVPRSVLPPPGLAAVSSSSLSTASRPTTPTTTGALGGYFVALRLWSHDGQHTARHGGLCRQLVGPSLYGCQGNDRPETCRAMGCYTWPSAQKDAKSWNSERSL